LLGHSDELGSEQTVFAESVAAVVLKPAAAPAGLVVEPLGTDAEAGRTAIVARKRSDR